MKKAEKINLLKRLVQKGLLLEAEVCCIELGIPRRILQGVLNENCKEK